MRKIIEIIVPCFNEEKCIRPFHEEIKRVFSEEIPNYDYCIFFVDDGSKDSTIDEIKAVASEEEKGKIKYVSFSRNFGKESALYVGFVQSTGDLIVPMDADLQHPPALLPQMIEAIEEGYDCAGACRISRAGETKIRSFFSSSFYYIINALTSIELKPGATDYRLMKRSVVDAIVSFTERERFTKGIYSWIGFKTKWIEYENVEREIGETKWSFRGLMHYALNGFLAFATRPLRLVVYFGMLVVLIAIIMAIYYSIGVLRNPEAVRNGFTSVIVVVTFFGGIITMILGVMGEYLARIYMEVKKRPIFIVRETNVDTDRKDYDKWEMN